MRAPDCSKCGLGPWKAGSCLDEECPIKAAQAAAHRAFLDKEMRPTGALRWRESHEIDYAPGARYPVIRGLVLEQEWGLPPWKEYANPAVVEWRAVRLESAG